MSNYSDFNAGPPPIWVSGATFAQGKFAISPTDFCTYIRKVAGAGATDPASDATNWQPFGARPVKSIQSGVASGGVVGTAITITAVNVSKSILMHLGQTDSSGTGAGQTRITLTNSTTITATAASSGVGSVGWQVIEYY